LYYRQSKSLQARGLVEGSLEGDLAAIEDGTGASFTVGSSPSASPCQVGKSETSSRVVGVPSGGVRDTGQPHVEPQKRSEMERSMLEKGRDLKFYQGAFCIYSHFPESEPNTTHKNAPTPRQQFARSGPC
jgi:hypothetical protein